MRIIKIITSVAFVTLIASCGVPADTSTANAECSGVGSDDIVLLASGTKNEPAPVLSSRDESVLRQAAKDSKSASVYIFDLAGGSPICLELSPMRGNKIENAETKKSKRVTENLASIKASLAVVKNTSQDFDLLELLNRTSRISTSPLHLITVSSGLSTSGGLDMRSVGWSADPAFIVDDLRIKQLLPALKDWNITFSGLGIVAGEQTELRTPQRRTLATYWEAVCLASGAKTCEVNDEPREMKPSTSSIATPVVFVPKITSIRGPNSITTSVPTDILGFTANSAVLGSDASNILQPIVEQAKHDNRKVIIRGYSVAIQGQANTPKLALERAQAVADKLVELGLPRHQITKITGEQPLAGAYVNGKFNEEKASQLRHVEIQQSL